MLTVDLPAIGNRERSKRHTVPMPPPPLVDANFVGTEEEGQEWVPVTWETVDWLRSITALPILIKGILTAEDARLSLEHGVSGIIVSNHGGRQLDGVVTLHTLQYQARVGEVAVNFFNQCSKNSLVLLVTATIKMAQFPFFQEVSMIELSVKLNNVLFP